MVPRPDSFLVWGAGGHGRVVGDLVRSLGYSLEGYVDADPDKLGRTVDPTDVVVKHLEEELIERIREHGRYPEGITACALGVGDNLARQRCLVSIDGLESPPLVHPRASVSPTTEIGKGTVVFSLAVVNTGARIGNAVIVNTGAIVEHDCVLESGVHVSPGAILCGGVHVGERAWIGAGSTVIPGIRIGSDVMVGAGSTVIRDVDDGTTVFGSPAHQRTELL